MRILTELLLFIGVMAPPGLVAARFGGLKVPGFLGTDVVLGFSTACLLGAFILASYVRPAHRTASAPRRRTRTRRSRRMMLPASDAFSLNQRTRRTLRSEY